MTLSPASSQPRARWTILQYSAADNNLKAFMVDDVDEMERVGSDAQTNLVVQLDTGVPDGARRLHLQKDADPGLRSPVVGTLGQVNMSSPATLADFVEWGVKSYPADHYMLVISDHGDGWKGAVEDDSHGGWMSLEDIRQGLETARQRTGTKLDVLGFDACNMAAVETAYQLKDEASYLVASEKTESAEGWPYTPWLNPAALQTLQGAMTRGIDLSPRDLVETVVHAASQAQDSIPTLSATDLGQMRQVGQAVDRFGKAILATNTSVWRMKRKVWSTESFEGYKDAADFAGRVASDPKIRDQALKDAAADLTQALKTAVVAEQHHPAYEGAHGLTLETPSFLTPASEYADLALSQDTSWNEAQKQLTRWWTIPRPMP